MGGFSISFLFFSALYSYTKYMDEDMLEDLVKENIRLTRENNKLLKKIRRGNIFGTLFRIVLFLTIIGVPFFIYRYYVEDYVTEVKDAYSELREDITNLKKTIPDRLSF